MWGVAVPGRDSSSAEAPYRTPSAEERALLAKLFDEGFRGSSALREQLTHARAWIIDMDGSLALEASLGAPRADVIRRIPVEES